MTVDQALEALSSPLPSERMRAAQVLLTSRRLDPKAEPLLIDAIAKERVPRIETLLIGVLRMQSGSGPDGGPEQSEVSNSGLESAAEEILQELSEVIRHELQPPIGWLRYAANGEIDDFPASDTHRVIESLRRRIDGLVALAEAHRFARPQRHSLSELLLGCVPADIPDSLFAMDIPDGLDDVILTDAGLFTLVVSNAMRNAVEAVAPLQYGSGQIFLALGFSDRDFWITISNTFAGASFDFQTVSASGVTSKVDHRGLGARVMRLAADRLNYEFDLKAVGGVATFSLRGPRENG